MSPALVIYLSASITKRTSVYARTLVWHPGLQRIVMNRLLEKLEIDLPIIQAPMAGVSTPAMAAAVSNAGALGSIGIGAVNAEGAREMIVATQELTKRSINVNVFCHRPAIANAQRESAWLDRLSPHFAKFNAQPPRPLQEIYKTFVNDYETLEVLLELKPKVVSFHFGLPFQATIAELKDEGIVLLASATNLIEAKQVAEAGIDAVVAQGYEAGGHRGIFNPAQYDERLGTTELIQLFVKELDIPVIAAGGIMDGAGISTALKLGASAAQLGTAFIDCPESSADEFYRAALHSDAARETVMTNAISGRPARCLSNLFTKLGSETDPADVPDYPIAYHAGKTLNTVAKEKGEGGYGAQWAGQGAQFARNLPAADLIDQLKQEIDRNSEVAAT